MLTRIIRFIIKQIIWRFIFDCIDRVNFLILINIFRAQLLALSPINNLRLIKDLVFNTITNNVFFRTFAITAGVNIRTLTDTRPKKIFFY